MILCSANSLSKSFGGHAVFNNLSMEVHDGDRIGLVGRNGTGKSTLFKLLTGAEHPDEGEIHLKKGAAAGYLEQVPVQTAHATVYDVFMKSFSEQREIQEKIHALTEKMKSDCDEKQLQKWLNQLYSLQEAYEEMGGYSIESKINGILKGLGLEEIQDHTFTSISGGEKTKVGLGCLLLQEPDLLLLDEPTNHLDLRTMEWLEEYLLKYKGAVVAISHDRYFLDRTVNKIYDLEDGQLTLYHGNYTAFSEEKEKRLLAEFAQYQEQQKQIKKMQEAIKRLREWAVRGDNGDLHRRARSMERALERMHKIKRPTLQRRKAEMAFQMKDRSGKDALALIDMGTAVGEREVLKQVDLFIRFGEKVAIVGNNGTGKSTLLKAIMGEHETTGLVEVGSSVKFGYLSQSGISYQPEDTVLSAFRDAVAVDDGTARHLLAKFLFYGQDVFKKVKDLSGGENTRLRFAQLVHQDVNFLLLDEPTNHLDIDSREVLEDAIEEYAGTVAAVSHDRYFLNKLFNRVAWLNDGKIDEYLGTYDQAREQR
ncbi:ribosomal protection-like ABC-F family protein [Fictibacillus fluitans]|uniref:ABC-F type ribosomal protection protein n=1 Tax=Fictibacillus fluitans TaxID=3058422 RepID=A0ABT8HSJ0_9BACL|nr:ABC-F type ribosomal protection protein [Fictibacillus sp. NE201]MDN4523743.1 ABC-F type ribosomal protection protein [Fictibacillus sp. NE201]